MNKENKNKVEVLELVVKFGVFRVLMGLIMLVVTTPIVIVWNLIMMVVQIIGFILIFSLDLLTFKVFHWSSNKGGIKGELYKGQVTEDKIIFQKSKEEIREIIDDYIFVTKRDRVEHRFLLKWIVDYIQKIRQQDREAYRDKIIEKNRYLILYKDFSYIITDAPYEYESDNDYLKTIKLSLN